MKNAVIVLGILCVLLAGLLFLRISKSRQQAEESTQVITSLSNELAKVQTQLVMNTALASDTQSNLQSTLDRRAIELANLSNRLAQARQSISAEQSNLETTRSELQAGTARMRELEAHLDQLNGRINSLSPLPGRVEDLEAQVASLTAGRDRILHELRLTHLAKANLERKLQDAHFLALQIEKVEEQNALARRMAKGDSLPEEGPLEWQPDGTVRVVPPPKAEPAPKPAAGEAK